MNRHIKPSEKFVGKEYVHNQLGRVKVNYSISHNKVGITCIDKGKFWCEEKQDVVTRRIFRQNKSLNGKVTRTYFTEIAKINPQYLKDSVCHIDELK